LAVAIQKTSAEHLLGELGIAEPQEIDVEAIAAHCNAYVVYEDLGGSDARIVGNHDKAFITVSTRASAARQRFSIGHELGHWMWDRGKIAFACSTDVQDHKWTGADRESLANRFSAELLMPESMFRPRMEKSEVTISAAVRLADEFTSSLTATAIRMVDCGFSPSMVLVHSAEGRVWFRASKEIEGRFWPEKMLDEYSFAHDLMKSKNRGVASGLVEADTWINHPRASWYEIHESSTMLSPDRVLTLLWWKSTKMVDELLGG
jgi:Zn-dependent peptidase ImmA (M78 family)